MYILIFKSPRDVMQIGTLSAESRFGPELVDLFSDAISILCGHLVVDLSLRADDQLCYYTNTGYIPSKICIRDVVEHLKSFDDEHTKPIDYASVPISFFQMQIYFSPVLPKKSSSGFFANA